MSSCKRILSAILAIVLCIGILPLQIIAANTYGEVENFTKVNTFTDDVFTDVNESDWFYDNVRSVYEYNLMLGKGDHIFDPESGVTLAETITIAARLHAMYYIGADVFTASEPWYQTYVDYAASVGIIEDVSDDLSVSAARGEFASILANAFPDSALPEINVVAYNGIPDVSLADSYGRDVYKLYRAGIIIGNDEIGTFTPQSEIRRSEVAAIVTRMVDPALRQSVQLGDVHTVSFDLNYREQKLPDQSVVEGYCAAEPDAPYREYYIFDGWYTEEKGGYKFEFETEILSDITLYAHWKIDPAWIGIIINEDKDEPEEPIIPEEPENPDEPEDKPEDQFDYASLPYRSEKTWEELTALNGGEEPYIELNDKDQIGLYIGRISDNKVDDVYDIIAELNNVRGLLNINDARFEFIPCYEDGRIDDNSYRVQQVYNGVQVWCAQIVVIVDDDGYIQGFINDYVDYVRFSGVPTEAAVSEEQAIKIAYEDAAGKFETVNENISAVLVIVPEAGSLIWYMTVNCGSSAYSYYVDAMTGRICGSVEILDQTASVDLSASDIESVNDATTSLYDATVNITRLHKTDNTDMFIFYDQSYYDKYWKNGNPDNVGVAVYNSVDSKGNRINPDNDVDSSGKEIIFPYNIIANTANEWYPDNNVVHYSGLYALYNFRRIMNAYANIGFIVDMPIEVSVNCNWDNACYAGANENKTAIEYQFGITSERNRIAQLDTIGHEYTHMVQDYYVGLTSVGAIDITKKSWYAWYTNGSLGIGYEAGIVNGDVENIGADSSNIDWVESKAISEGTADIMGMLIEAYCEGIRLTDADFWSFGEDEDNNNTTRDHSASNTVGNQTVAEMVKTYEGTALKYGAGPGHDDGYIVVGILRYLVENTNLSIQQYLKLWFSTITILNPKSEFDHLRFALVLAAKKLGMDAYIDTIIDACASVGITYDRKENVYNAWFYKGLEKAYLNDIISQDNALNNAKNLVSRREYLTLLAAMCEKVGVDVGADAVAWARELKAIGDFWTGSYLDANIPRWQASLLMYQIFNHYHKQFQNYGWKVIYGYKFVDENGTDRWQKFHDIGFDDWGTHVTGINLEEMIQYYKGIAEYVDNELSEELTITNFQEQYMASLSPNKTYVTGKNDENTRWAMYYMGFYQLWINGMFNGYSESGIIRLGTTGSMSLGEVCALITQVIPD